MEVFLGNILIAVIAAFLASSFSIQRFQSEKWWEIKIETYKRIFESLYHSKAFLEYHYDHYISESHNESTEIDNELRQKLKISNEEISKITDMSSFLLSEDSSAILKKYKEDSKLIWQDNPSWFDCIDTDLYLTKKCLDNLIVSAKKDLEKSPFAWTHKIYQNFLNKKLFE